MRKCIARNNFRFIDIITHSMTNMPQEVVHRLPSDGITTALMYEDEIQDDTSLSISGISSQEEESLCSFPEWMNGHWEGLTIDGSSFVYRDEHNFVTYKGKCLEAVDQSASNNDRDAELGKVGLKYLLQLKTECGEVSYNCALFQRRDSNVMEFQLGKSDCIFYALRDINCFHFFHILTIPSVTTIRNVMAFQIWCFIAR